MGFYWVWFGWPGVGLAWGFGRVSGWEARALGVAHL